MNTFKQSIVMFLVMTLICGLIYPLAITGIAQVAFPYQAKGSIIELPNGRGKTSELLGQEFTGEGYFWSRLSATSPMAYNAGASSGSNLGPSNPQLAKNMQERRQKLHGNGEPPIDLITSSASGLDPHISPESANYQIQRVANARGMSVAQVESLVRDCTEGRQFGVLGEPRVNVLRLNILLDKLKT